EVKHCQTASLYFHYTTLACVNNLRGTGKQKKKSRFMLKEIGGTRILLFRVHGSQGREVTCVLGARTFKPPVLSGKPATVIVDWPQSSAAHRGDPLKLLRRRLQHEQPSPTQRNCRKRCLGFACSIYMGFQTNIRES